jgi:hypothetical protein
MKTDARAFLEGLFSGKPDNLLMLLWTLPEKRSYWVSDIRSALKRADCGFRGM